jgi:hypothetical protein
MNDETDRADVARRGSPYLTTRQAAFFLKISERALRRMRVRGDGPIVRRHARMALYHIDDLLDWSRACVDQGRDGGEA